MSEHTNDDDADEIAPAPIDELSLLKERARTLGISVTGNISVETLKKRIAAKLADAPEEPEDDRVAGKVEKAERPKTKAEIEQEIRDRLEQECLVLVRCRITNLNPNKRDLPGEIITVANRFLGTVRKFIPFGEESNNGYHIPKILYDDLKARQFQQVKTRRDNQGNIHVSTKLVPEYAIEILPPLTTEELQELALKQAAAERLSSD